MRGYGIGPFLVRGCGIDVKTVRESGIEILYGIGIGPFLVRGCGIDVRTVRESGIKILCGIGICCSSCVILEMICKFQKKIQHWLSAKVYTREAFILADREYKQ